VDRAERAADYMARAAEAEEAAAKLADSQLRDSFLQLAQSWRDLATTPCRAPPPP